MVRAPYDLGVTHYDYGDYAFSVTTLVLLFYGKEIHLTYWVGGLMVEPALAS
jgi:hypothetical protein